MLGGSCIVVQLAASRERLSSMDSISIVTFAFLIQFVSSQFYAELFMKGVLFEFAVQVNKFLCRVSGTRWQRKRQTIINYNNSVGLVLKRTIPTERPPLVGEFSAKF
jgi:hypothetical protein